MLAPRRESNISSGRETTAVDGRLQQLQSGAHWPRTISVLILPRSRKRANHTPRRSSFAGLKPRPPQLRISWAVFLPVSEDSDIVIPLEGKALPVPAAATWLLLSR